MTSRAGWTALACALTLVACDGPSGGEIEFALNGPHAVAALRFKIVATQPETIDTVTAACAGCKAYMVRSGERDVRGVVVGDLSGGVLRVTVSTLDVPDMYTATVLEVALSDYSTVSASGFTLVGPPAESR